MPGISRRHLASPYNSHPATGSLSWQFKKSQQTGPAVCFNTLPSRSDTGYGLKKIALLQYALDDMTDRYTA